MLSTLRFSLISLFTLLFYLPYAQCPILIWQDEFNGSELDLTKWEPQIGDGCSENLCGWGNNELQYYKAENAVVSNGTLKLIAKKERIRGTRYTSARLRTKGLADFTFGRFEARIKLPVGQGLWPAFWMLSTNEPYGGWPQSGEIDIMEYLGQHPEEVFGTIHYGDPYPNNQFTGKDYTEYDGSTFAEDFHVFAVEWEPGVLRWYVDDVLYQTLTNDDITPYNWPFDAGNQMHFLLNVAVGGNLPGDPDATTPFPSQMEVDYVRVYDGGFNPSISGDRLVANQASGEVYTINNAPNGSSFNWTVPAGAIITSGAGTSSISVNWGSTGGNVSCQVATNCITDTYQINVLVEPPYTQEFSFENFDTNGNAIFSSTTGTLTEVANPSTSGINTSTISGEYIRNSGEQYDLLVYNTSSINNADLYVTRDKKFYMDVLTQAPVGTEIIIQLENSSSATATNYPAGRHSRYVGTITQNGSWERIAFDHLDQPDGSTDPSSVDQIIILFNSNSFTGDTYYFDNFDSYIPDDGSGTSNSAPTASYTFSTTDLTADFDGTGSSDSDGSISSWSWDFGDGNTGSGSTASYTYAVEGDYNVTLTVADNEGATDQTTQTVTVTAPSTGDPVSMHVQSIVAGTVSAPKGSKFGSATITIHDNQENPLANATVTGTFSGTFNETLSGTTGADGTITLVTSSSAKGGVTVNLCVDEVTHASLAYDASMNDITCTGSGSRALILSNNDAVQDYSISFYPNPVLEVLNLNLIVTQKGRLSVSIVNPNGQIVASHHKEINIGEHNISINTSHMESGMYFIHSEINGVSTAKRIIKK